jgi:predicted aspartyl protease
MRAGTRIVSVRTGSVRGGHPYIDILVSPDGRTIHKRPALIDTGFGGFISIPISVAARMGLESHASTRYTLADGRPSDPVPLAYGYACVEGDTLTQGLFAISEHTSTVIGMDFIAHCWKVLILFSSGVIIMNWNDFNAALEQAASREIPPPDRK